MDRHTKLQLLASSTASFATWTGVSNHSIVSALTTATVVGIYMGVAYILSRNSYTGRYEAAVLVNNVCPSCLVPNGVAELTSNVPDEKWCHCIACNSAYALASDGKGYIAARRLGKIEVNEHE